MSFGMDWKDQRHVVARQQKGSNWNELITEPKQVFRCRSRELALALVMKMVAAEVQMSVENQIKWMLTTLDVIVGLGPLRLGVW